MLQGLSLKAKRASSPRVDITISFIIIRFSYEIILGIKDYASDDADPETNYLLMRI